MLDLLICGGLIVDGTGNPGFYGAVGIEGETLRILRGDTTDVAARRIIDASGRTVCPGFIDVHAHSGLMILAEPRHEPKVRQGITTELIGIDGNSYAPFRTREDFVAFLELNAGLDGAPLLPGTWSSVAEYLRLFDHKVAVNIAYLVGNSPLRIATVGWGNIPVAERDLTSMRALLRESMEEGAFGMSTGLDYPPGSYATTDELVSLSAEVARLGGLYHTHVRYRLGDQFLDPFREAVEIGVRAGVATHVTHLFQRRSAPGGSGEILGVIEQARDRGLDITFDSQPYAEGNTRLLIVFPDWAHDGGPTRLKEVLRSGEGRERLRREIVPRGPSWHEIWLTYFKQPHNQRYEGRSVAEIAEQMGKHEVDAMCDLLLDEDLQVSYVTTSINAATMPRFVSHPLSMVGSDAVLVGAHPSPRTYGAFPMILGSLVREEGQLSLPQAIRMMTSFAAQRLGLPDRGLLRDGMKADVVVFDQSTVRATATRHEPKQFPVGIDYVLVNGQVVIDQNRHTGRLPGRALRRGRAST